jgi:regulator of protease activity HflC (stomatin/prohibitin superfamily)
MIWFIFAVIIIVAAAITAIVSVKADAPGFGFIVGITGIIVAAILVVVSCLYSQDAGEVTVLKNMGGSIAGSSIDAGFHGKAPWQSTVKYDTRNNVISYVAKGQEDYNGGSANGPQVTVNDKSGASANIDLQVNYSLDPKYATRLYREYGKQETFVRSVAAVDARSVPRDVAGQFDTISLLTQRGKFTDAVQKALSEKWESLGLHVEQVSVQEIRYPKSITDRYAQAQAANIDLQKAVNEQQVAKTKAETKKIQAQGEAAANDVLNKSLTDNVLKQKYIDALANAKQLIVTPDGANTLIQPGK